MRFVIIRDENIVSVDNCQLTVNCAALASNIALIAYVETEGKLQYNDRPGQLTAFTDPAPYQPYINNWITAAAAQTPALQLAQAKQVKNDLIEAIFHHKRRLPYRQGPWDYDARDQSVMFLTESLRSNTTVSVTIPADSSLVTNINTALATITGQVNNQVVAVNNVSAGNVNGWSLTNYVNWTTLLFYDNPQAVPYPGTVWYSNRPTVPTVPGYGGFSTMSNVAGATVAGAGASGTGTPTYVGTITITPLNATAPQTVASSDVNAALTGITTRRNTLNGNRMTKQTAVNNLTTITAIVAYDATTGWAF